MICDLCGNETTPGVTHVCFGGQDPPMPTRRGAAILAELVERAHAEMLADRAEPQRRQVELVRWADSEVT